MECDLGLAVRDGRPQLSGAPAAEGVRRLLGRLGGAFDGRPGVERPDRAAPGLALGVPGGAVAGGSGRPAAAPRAGTHAAQSPQHRRRWTRQGGALGQRRLAGRVAAVLRRSATGPACPALHRRGGAGAAVLRTSTASARNTDPAPWPAQRNRAAWHRGSCLLRLRGLPATAAAARTWPFAQLGRCRTQSRCAGLVRRLVAAGPPAAWLVTPAAAARRHDDDDGRHCRHAGRAVQRSATAGVAARLGRDRLRHGHDLRQPVGVDAVVVGAAGAGCQHLGTAAERGPVGDHRAGGLRRIVRVVRGKHPAHRLPAVPGHHLRPCAVGQGDRARGVAPPDSGCAGRWPPTSAHAGIP